jgi:Fe-Mn family superoxide dismutase
MAINLPELPYQMDALEPFISKKTLEFHYGKHHQTYVTNINKLTAGTEYENASLEDMIKKASGGIFNNAAQVWNHTFFWNCMKPKGDAEPKGPLADAINKYFGSFSQFKEKFASAATTLFGSGWAWLVKKSDGSLDIIQESNAGNPLKNGHIAILTCDVWEHAYYLDYQNRRPDFVNTFMNHIDWEAAAKRF